MFDGMPDYGKKGLKELKVNLKKLLFKKQIFK